MKKYFQIDTVIDNRGLEKIFWKGKTWKMVAKVDSVFVAYPKHNHGRSLVLELNYQFVNGKLVENGVILQETKLH